MKLPYNINKFHVVGAVCMVGGIIGFVLNLLLLDNPFLSAITWSLFILISAAFMTKGDKIEDKKMFDRIRKELDAKDIFNENPNPNPDYEPPKTYHVKVQLKRKSPHKHPHKPRKYEIYYE